MVPVVTAVPRPDTVSRTGIYEVMEMTDGLRQLFLNNAPRHELWAQTMKDGTIPLRKDGMLKVKQGTTTPYEVLRVAESGAD